MRISAWMLGAAAAAAAPLWCGSAAAQEATFDQALALAETDPVAAVALLEQMSDRGDADAQNLLAVILENPPDGVAADPERAVRLWETAIAAGSDAARINLGDSLLRNDKTADDARGVALLQAVEDEGFYPARAFALGAAYLFGTGVPVDHERGAALLQEAMAFRPQNSAAQYLLARAYQNGWGLTQDATLAARHFKLAADAGHAPSQWFYAMALMEGDGVRADPVRARRYVEQSAAQGYDQGMISLAVMLALGQGGPADHSQARIWYQRAAEMGSAHALRGLGMMLVVGEGGPVDYERGAAYLEMAAEAGDENAVTLRAHFADQLATLDQAAVDRIKAAWIRQHGTPQ